MNACAGTKAQTPQIFYRSQQRSESTATDILQAASIRAQSLSKILYTSPEFK